MSFKKISLGIFIHFVFALGTLLFGRDYIYTHQGRDIHLQAEPARIFVQFDRAQSVNQAAEILRPLIGQTFTNRLLNKDGRFQLLELKSYHSVGELESLISSLRQSGRLVSAAPVLHRPDKKEYITFNCTFVVRFSENLTFQQIRLLNARYNVSILKNIFNKTFLLQSNDTQVDGFQLAQTYSQFDEIEWAQPNFYYLDWGLLNSSVNDPLWEQQWAHRNVGQLVASGAKSAFPQQVRGIPNADMDVDLAWDALVQNGGQAGGSPDILVAMLDSGVDLTHPDLADNLFSTGKDFSPDQGSDANDVQGHGTATAGIVAALGNNGIGVAGIAFNAKILPVKIFTTYGMADDADIAQAIDYAWQNGADILSNSWSGSTPNSVIDDAIHRAKTQGRDGKGCVIVFSSGNEGHGTVSYPASLADVIAVGVSNMFDEKKNPGSHDFQRNWGGNYGSALDLVAPTIVYSTDIQGSAGYDEGDYFDHFGGTSAACPQVAGVAALVLSANAALTSDEVQNLLQKSADKIDRYPFDTNGWNEDVGYGRVNAYHAVRYAFNENGDTPLISVTPLQPTSSVEARTITAIITDDDGLAQENGQPALFYRTIFQGDTSIWHKIVDSDGPIGNEYDFTIPAMSWGNEVQYYIRATDNTPDSLTSTFPSFGKSTDAPPYLLHYFVGDFEIRTFTSSDVPVSIADDNIYYTSTLEVDDTRPIVDLNATISISKHIEDLAVALEAPDSTASGIVNHNGEPGDSYTNTVLDDEADIRITDGTSPYSGSFKPDNALWVFDGVTGNGTWTLRAYDDTYYNNGGSIDGWSLDITYMQPIHPPVVSDIPDQTIDEGQSFTQFDLDDYVTDEDNTDDEISWSYSGNKDLIVNIDSITHVATVQTPNDDWSGSETIIFTATDPTLLSDSDAATFTVTPVNDPPVVSDIPDQTIEEGQSFASFDLDDYVSDPDNDDAELSWTYSGNVDLTVEIDANTHVCTVSVPDANWNGSETITFTATDPGGLSDSDPATFTVTPVNDPPVVSDIPDQTIDEGGQFVQIVLDDYVSDPDNADSELSWSYTGNHELLVSIDANRVATVSPPDSNWNGSETITFTATDPGGLSDQDAATFTVNPVNDAPRITSTPDTIAIQDELYQYQVVAEDVDSNETLSYSLLTAPSFLSIDSQTGLISGTPNEADVGKHAVSVQVKDSHNATDQQDYTLTVKNQNDPPVVSDIPDQTIDEGGQFAQIILDDYVSDPDNADSELSWSYTGNHELLVSIDANRVATVSPPDSNWNGSEIITFTATDPKGALARDSARFTVKPVEDAPKVVQALPILSFKEDDSLLIEKAFWYPFIEDVDTPDSALHFQLLGGKHVFSKASNEAHLLFAQPNWFGYDSLFLKFDDRVNFDSAWVQVMVKAVNDPPEIIGFPDSIKFFKGDSFYLKLKSLAQDIDTPYENLHWEFEIPDSGFSIEVDSRSETLMLFSATFIGNTKLFIKLLDDSGAFDLDTSFVLVEDTLTSLKDLFNAPYSYRVWQNFPNPFNPTTTISFELRHKARVRIDFFDLMGQQVLKIIEQPFSAGKQHVKINANNLSSGIYFYRVRIFENGKVVYSKVKKMIFIK